MLGEFSWFLALDIPNCLGIEVYCLYQVNLIKVDSGVFKVIQACAIAAYSPTTEVEF